MGLVFILLITLSRFCLPESSAAGVLSISRSLFPPVTSLKYFRCTGHQTDLDEEGALPRTERLKLASVEAFAYKELWEDYGIIEEISVFHRITTFMLSRSHSSIQQPFTEAFHQAEIYELLSPDLLHQLIKGTFKDHLVQWVIDYIENEHTAHDAKRIKDIVDHW